MTNNINRDQASKITVSVILLTVNRFEFLDDSISSLINQTFTDWELLIVQDGNNLDVTEKIKSFVEKDQRISFYQRPNLNSIGSSINYAINRARGKYIAILDDDDIWIDRYKLAKQIKLFNQNSDLTLTASWAIGINKKGEKISEIKKTNDIEIIRKTCLIFNPVIHSSSLYRKDIALEIGLYNELIPDYQDWDFALKIIKKGEIIIVPEFMIAYRLWEGNSSSTKVASMARSTFLIIKNHRRNFPNSFKAFVYYFFLLLYSKLPFKIKSITAKYLSVIKKNSFNRFS